MLEQQQYLFFLMLIYGAGLMIYIHNFFISVLLYKSRQANGSNILKIIFNFSGIVIFLCKFSFNATPSTITTLGCKALYYFTNTTNLIYRGSLSTFLLWRLKQIGPTEYDKFISFALIIARTACNIVYIVMLNPYSLPIPNPYTFLKSYNYCEFNWIGSFNSQSAYVAVDTLIDIYVTVRLIIILRRANKNAAQISINTDSRAKRTLFTAVMYWNFVRLFTSFGQNMILLALTTLSRYGYNLNYDQAAAENFFQVFFLILISYTVTVDAEIVKVIEGKRGSQKGRSSSSGNKKSYPGTPGARTPPAYKKYNSSTQSYNDVVYDENKFNVSMKRLSFFEWANIVVGFRREDGNKQEFESDELEEIIDGSSKAADLDLEKRDRDLKHDSDISGTSTITSTTLSNEHDIV